MSRRLATWMTIALVSCTSANRRPDPPAARPGVATSADELFALAFVPELALTLTEDARAALVADPRTYVAATFAHGGRRYAVQVKLKGNRTFRELDDKPGLRVTFDDDGFLGLHALVLNNLLDDPTGVREILAYRIYRAAGVPAPRAAYARVTIDGAPYGTYLMVEPVDAQLLGEGVIFEGEYGCDVFPADAPRIELKHGPETARDDFAALGALADRDPHALFQPGSPLDVDEVLGFLATTALIADFDGYWHSHNYYVARADDGRWRLVPWGNDRVLYEDVGLYDSQGRLARLCFADDDCRLAYAKQLRALADQLDTIVPAAQLVDELAVARALLDDDVRSTRTPAKRAAERAELRAFVAGRPAAIRAALERAEVPQECDADDVDAPRCACELVHAGGADLHLCDLPTSWDHARAFCEAKGLTLARLDSIAQIDAVAARALDLRYDRWWLGARQADDASFTWVDGAPFDFTRWGEGEPSNHRCQQRCLVLDDSEEGTWALGHCELFFPFVCR